MEPTDELAAPSAPAPGGDAYADTLAPTSEAPGTLTFDEALEMLRSPRPSEDAAKTDDANAPPQARTSDGRFAPQQPAQDDQSLAEDASTGDDIAAAPEAPTFDATPFVEAFPDLAGQDAAGIVEALRRERAANDAVLAIVERAPVFEQFVKAVGAAIAAGQTPDLAVLAAGVFGAPDAVPDYDEDAEGYRAAIERQTERRVRAEYEQQQQAAQEQEAARYREQAAQSVDALAKAEGWDEGATRRYREQIAAFVDAPPANAAAIIYKGLNAERLIADAEARGLAKGRAEGAQAANQKAQKGGDGIARFSGTAPAPRSGSETDAQRLAAQFAQRSDDIYTP